MKPTTFQRFITVAIVAIITLGVGAVAGWSAQRVFTPSAHDVAPASFTLAKVTVGEVGSHLNLTATAQWIATPTGSNRAQGTVTTINVRPGQLVAAGDVLYSVNLRPVTVAVGDVPAFERMAAGQRGTDVLQLQQLLNTLGFLSQKATGTFDRQTTSAVKAWQRKQGVHPDGIVEVGDIIFVPALPSRLLLDPAVIKIGTILGGGEAAVDLLPPDPTFTISIDASQAILTPVGVEVDIAVGETHWKTVVERVATDEKSGTLATLKRVEPGNVCSPDCSSIPFTGTASLPAEVITVPTVSGLTVPSSALGTDAGGRASVLDRSGRRRPVEVVSSAKGMSVIKGVPEGMLVRLPGPQ